MATARLTVGTILDTVNTAAGTVTQTLNAVSDTVGMANAFIRKAANEQTKRYKMEAATFDARLIDEKAQEETMLDLRSEEFINRSEKHKEYYLKNLEKYKEILAH